MWMEWVAGVEIFIESVVIGKGLISFAAQKCRGTGEKPEAAKVMRPRGELNRDQTSGYGD
jgi:hypothetical protein